MIKKNQHTKTRHLKSLKSPECGQTVATADLIKRNSAYFISYTNYQSVTHRVFKLFFNLFNKCKLCEENILLTKAKQYNNISVRTNTDISVIKDWFLLQQVLAK